MSESRVVSLHIYPIKSCGAIHLESMNIGPRGPLYDRGWMIVDESSGQFLTQREKKEMALIETRLSGDRLVLSIPSVVGGSSAETSSGISKQIAVSLKGSTTLPATPRTVTVWSDDCEAMDEGDEAAQELSIFFGKRVRLVHMAPHFERRLAPKYGHPDAHTGFADGFPFLLANSASLNELNSRLDTPVPMSRFRANIVIAGHDAFAEDTWRTIRIGEGPTSVTFDFPKPCSRCIVINTDQDLATRSPEPLKTLSTYRRNESGKVIFGQNLVHLNQGTIRVGDQVTILA